MWAVKIRFEIVQHCANAREAGCRWIWVVAVMLFTGGCRFGRPATESGVAWSYGGGLDRVISGPSRDAAGNLHVMVVHGTDDPTRHEGIFLVMVDARGRELRRTQVTDARRESPVNPWNRWALRSPLLGGDGSAWLIHAGEVVRIDPAGTIRWRVAFPHAHLMPEGNTYRRPDFGGAVGPDGVLFVTAPSYVMALSPEGK